MTKNVRMQEAGTALFLVARQREVASYANLITQHLEDSHNVLAICLGRSTDDMARSDDIAFFDACVSCGLHQEDMLLAFDRALPGKLTPWSFERQLRDLVKHLHGVTCFAPSPTASSGYSDESQALGITALRLARAGVVERAELLACGGDGQAFVVRDAYDIDELEIDWARGLQKRLDEAVGRANTLEVQMNEAKCRQEGLARELEALHETRAYRLGATLAQPYRVVHDWLVRRRAHGR